MSLPVPLKYHFEALFFDGSIITQTPEDISALDPIRSQFYDVVQRMDEVHRFSLTDGKNVYLVDLTDGHFEINGITFNTQDPSNVPPASKWRLIFFRRHQHHFRVGTTEEIGHTIEYHIGRQTTTPQGKNYQQTISIS